MWILVSLHDINMRKPFKSSVMKENQIIGVNTRPHAISEVYHWVEPAPALRILNSYRSVTLLRLMSGCCCFKHCSFISVSGISFNHSRYFYSTSSSPLLLRGAPDYGIDTVSELTRRSATGNCE